MTVTRAEQSERLASFRAPPGEALHRLRVVPAKSAADVHAAQRLCDRVFAGALAAKLTGREPGRDEDIVVLRPLARLEARYAQQFGGERLSQRDRRAA